MSIIPVLHERYQIAGSKYRIGKEAQVVAERLHDGLEEISRTPGVVAIVYDMGSSTIDVYYNKDDKSNLACNVVHNRINRYASGKGIKILGGLREAELVLPDSKEI